MKTFVLLTHLKVVAVALFGASLIIGIGAASRISHSHRDEGRQTGDRIYKRKIRR